MLIVRSDNVIELTRGDTARLTIALNDDTTGEPYEVQPEDTLRFSVKKSTADTTLSFQKVITGSNTFHIEPSDTKMLSFGIYVYDVEITNSLGDVYTVIPPTKFKVLQEVD